MELLQTAAARTQKRFDYMPGRSLDEQQPLAFFQDDELIEVTGGQVK
jgi:formate dehydrogenase subunit beta